MVRLRLSVLLVGFLCMPLASPTLAAPKERPSSAADRAKAVRLARELEADPLGEAAAEARQWIVEFYQKVPDITISICNHFGPVTENEHPFFGELLAQFIASSGAYIIEHPEQAEDEVAVQTAGVEGMVKVYETLVKVSPEGRTSFLDDLVKKRDQGTLREHVRQAIPKICLSVSR